jgi:hypothetical protein
MNLVMVQQSSLYVITFDNPVCLLLNPKHDHKFRETPLKEFNNKRLITKLQNKTGSRKKNKHPRCFSRRKAVVVVLYTTTHTHFMKGYNFYLLK